MYNNELALFSTFILMMKFLPTYGADHQSSLRRGRIDGSLLPPEALLWHLTANIDYRHPSWVLEKRNFFRTSRVSPCTWAGVTCDAHKTVVSLDWSRESLSHPIKYHMQGNLTWENLPRTLQSVSVARHLLHGTMDTRVFPPELTSFTTSENGQSGPIDLSSLPSGITTVRFNVNAHTGTVDLTSLPAGLVCLNLSRNLFTGEIDLGSLPGSLRRLVLSNNRLSGIVDFTAIHERREVEREKDIGILTMLRVNLEHNYFSRYVPAGPLPRFVPWDPMSPDESSEH